MDLHHLLLAGLPAHSAVTPIADKHGCGWNVRYVPIATDAPQQTASLFDHLIGATDQCERDCEAQRLRYFKIDDHLDFRRPLDRQVARLLAIENPTSIDTRCTVRVRKTASVAHQAAGRGERAKLCLLYTSDAADDLT